MTVGNFWWGSTTAVTQYSRAKSTAPHEVISLALHDFCNNRFTVVIKSSDKSDKDLVRDKSEYKYESKSKTED